MEAKRKFRGAGFVRGLGIPSPEGEWDDYEFFHVEPDEGERGADETGEAVPSPENYNHTITGGDAGLGEGTLKMAEGPEELETTVRFGYPDENSGFEAHSRTGDEAGLTVTGSENWTRQEFGSLAEEGTKEGDDTAPVSAEGVPTVHRDNYAQGDDKPAFSYTRSDEPLNKGRFYTDEDNEEPPVRSYSTGTQSDEEIYLEIRDRLAAQPDVEGTRIEIEVSRGAVTLSGTVGSEIEKYIIQEVVDKVTGVRDIHDELRLKE